MLSGNSIQQGERTAYSWVKENKLNVDDGTNSTQLPHYLIHLIYDCQTLKIWRYQLIDFSL